MPFQPINYANIAPQGNPWVRDFVENMTKGYQAGRLPYETQQAEQKQDLDNKKQQLANVMQILKNREQPQKFDADQAKTWSDVGLNNANTSRVNAESQMPFGGKEVGGAIGQSMWLNYIGKKYGQNSPEYVSAKNAYDLDQQKTQTLNKYRSGLTDTMQKRFASPLAKLQQEKADIMNGYMPGTNTPLPPEQQQSLLDQNELDTLKVTSDAKAREKSRFATNIDNTINNINTKDLLQYGGIQGQANLKKDMLSSAIGKPSDNYIRYQKALTNAQLLSKQVRQFYGDSIQPKVGEELQELANPATWLNNPQVAQAKYNAFVKTLGQETGTYKKSLKSTAPYEENSSKSSSSGKATLKYNPATGKLEAM